MSLPEIPIANPTLALMADHRSVRDYSDEPVSHELLAELVDVARMASTSSHVQAYAVIHVERAGLREQLAELCGGQAQVARAGAFLVLCGDERRHQLLAEREGQPHARNLESFMVSVVDASLFAQNLCLAAEARGLGVCYIGGLRNDLPAVDALLELPDGVYPLYGLCLGLPASRPPRKPRLPVSTLLSRDGYPDDEALHEGLEAYDAEMGAYYGERGLTGRDWSGGVVRKNAVARRPGLADYYRSKGARLDAGG